MAQLFFLLAEIITTTSQPTTNVEPGNICIIFKRILAQLTIFLRHQDDKIQPQLLIFANKYYTSLCFKSCYCCFFVFLI